MERRQFIKKSAALVSTSALTSCSSIKKEQLDIPIIDAHVHFFTPKFNAPKTVKPKDFTGLTNGLGIKGCIFIEAVNTSQELDYNPWILKLAEDNPSVILGVVGSLSPGTDSFQRELNKFKDNKKFFGIRLRTPPKKRGIQNPNHFTHLGSVNYIKDLEKLAETGKVVEVLTDEERLPEILKITKLIPELKVIPWLRNIWESPGKTSITKEWISNIKKFSKSKNVYFKFGAANQNNLELRKKALDILFSEFGEDRLMFRSNWPSAMKSKDYSKLIKTIRKYMSSYPSPVQNKFFHKNAELVYKI